MIEKKTNPGLADVRAISDPPDMGKLRPAEDVAAEVITMHSWLTTEMFSTARDVGRARAELARLIRQSRAEGAAAALEAAAEHFANGRRDPEGAALLRARIKSISDPPDMG